MTEKKKNRPRREKSSSKKIQSDHVFTLHIGAIPQHPKIQTGGPSHTINDSHAAPVIHNPFDVRDEAPPSRLWAFIWDKLQFVFVSIGVFLVIYVVMNWSALELNAKHYWDVWRGFKSPLEQIVDTTANLQPEKLLVTSSSPTAEVIPPLNIEVYPPDMRIVIPRINQNVPVVGVKNDNLIARKWQDLEADIQKALRNGVIHYPGTALPGENGNVVLTGHSSYYTWDPGRFKDVFALLHDVKEGDKVVIYFNQRKYTYEISNIKVVLPKDVDVLGPADTEQLTLITCTPIGTNLKRLIVHAKLISKT